MIIRQVSQVQSRRLSADEKVWQDWGITFCGSVLPKSLTGPPGCFKI